MSAENKALFVLQNTKPLLPSAVSAPPLFSISLANEFELKLSPSTKEISSYLCDKDGSKYCILENMWQFHISHYSAIVKKCIPSQSKIDGTPASLLRALSAKYQEEAQHKKMLPVSIPDKMVSLDGKSSLSLQPHQIEGVLTAHRRKYRLLIADEMGLGKTLQAIAISKMYLSSNPNEVKRSIFIVAPSSNTAMWVNEVKKYITNRCYDVKDWAHRAPPRENEISALIVSYNGASTHTDILNHADFFMGIADESQSLKNTESKRSKSLVPFLSKMKQVILLSGTPALSNTSEMYTQISIIYPFLFSYTDYHERYCRISENHYNASNPRVKHIMKYKGSKNLDELKIAVNSLILIRRIKQECLQLGEKKRIHVSFKTELYARETNLKIQAVTKKGPSSEIMMEYTKTAVEKIDDVLSFIKQKRNSTNDKIIVFAHHKEVLNRIYAAFKERAIKIDGSTVRQKREALCDVFRNNEKIDVAVLSLKACSTGLTLVCARVVIFAELPWSPGDLHQAEDRIYRIGQTETVKIYYLIASNVDRQIWPLLRRKNNTLTGIGITEKDNVNIKFEVFDPKQKKIQDF
ncbi:SWI/SNF-related matrix-associated actin-dependent regulator of chromatin subfamily A-like protein 1 [Nematocida minor]|uniref:SWI/SNF-related matrix-associated actin-dependent regulator of chromatin subfamily A-like protein 1 n=1 Tax=Nematocida minor TaxID=1912983 RepID=UPI00221E40CA|nr:SWI/SNF-related matrix-associated actin-dependent regulator of chromatin subfamily A-like protein 1 [Nematocida minor]KAI5189389.1 SWI/SNF-related matrix-associated actin-dependent regulator of chromatin subfamily A-like protein 1 [Nematocida minor]